VKKSLQSLPCVEPDSVTIDFDAKEAHFTTKKDSTNLEDVKQAVKDSNHGHVVDYKIVK
jgi:copper chaperone CopZ